MRLRTFVKFSTLVIALAATVHPALASKDNPIVRETLGTVEMKGWEKNLVRGNPNLKHWHWNPVYSNVHCYKRVKAGPMPMKNDVRFKSLSRGHDRHVYQKPNHMAPPGGRNRDGSQRPNPEVSSNLATHDLNGQLYRQQVQAELAAKKVQAELAAKKVSAQLSTSKVNGSLVAKDASGQLMSPILKSYSSSYKQPAYGLEEYSPGSGCQTRRVRSAVYGQLAGKTYGQSTRF